MEEEILDKLNEKYQHIKLDVEYVDLRKYKIKISIKTSIEVFCEFTYIYDAKLTFDYNICIIEHEIDSMILSYFKKGE